MLFVGAGGVGPLVGRLSCGCTAVVLRARTGGTDSNRRAAGSEPARLRRRTPGIKVEPEGIEPSFQRCERCVLPLDDDPDLERSSRGGIRTRTGAVFKAAVSPDWTTHEITINRRLVP